MRINRLNWDAAALTHEKSRDNLCLSVMAEYFRFSLNRKLAEVKQQQLDLVQKQYRSVNSQYEQGFKTKKDFLRFQAQTQLAEIDVRNAKVDMENNIVNLKGLLGVSPRSFENDQDYAFQPIDPSSLEVTVPPGAPSVEGTYEFRIAKLQTDVQPLQVNLAQRKFWPQVNLTTGATYTNGSYLGSGSYWGGTENYVFNALLQVKFNFLDWGIRGRDIEVAKANEIIQENQLRQTELTTASTIRQLILQLDLLKRNYDTTKQLLSAEEEAYAFSRRDYDEGKIQAYDLILGLTELLNARVSYYQAQYNLAEAVARYHYYSGDLYAKLSL